MLPENARNSVLVKHALLSSRERREIEQFLSKKERMKLKTLLSPKKAKGSKSDHIATSNKFSGNSRRVAQLLGELVGADNRVLPETLTQEAAKSMQAWLDINARRIEVVEAEPVAVNFLQALTNFVRAK
jgi:hypothetical protein